MARRVSITASQFQRRFTLLIQIMFYCGDVFTSEPSRPHRTRNSADPYRTPTCFPRSFETERKDVINEEYELQRKEYRKLKIKMYADINI